MSEKHILIEFLGGDMDGRTLDNHSFNPNEQLLVQCCMSMTADGTIGRAFHGVSMTMMEAMMRGEMSPSDLKCPKGRHKYTVSERLDDGDEALIVMKYSVEKFDHKHSEKEGLRKMPLREIKRREASRPVINKEYHDVLVGSDQSNSLCSYLREQGINVQEPVEACTKCDLIKLDEECKVEDVALLIEKWILQE